MPTNIKAAVSEKRKREKAQLLIDEGKWSRLEGGLPYAVRGYIVVVPAAKGVRTGGVCSCQAGQAGVRCSHVVAAEMLRDQQ
jgi:hypothetical protein